MPSSEIRGAAGEMEGLPGVSPEMAGKMQRAMQGIERAQVKVNKVVEHLQQCLTSLEGHR
ncbi:MAG: hypothetical protein QM805_03085 [Pseudomonas sp.]